MKFSNVAFLTLAALIAQDSMSEASSFPEVRLSNDSGLAATNSKIDQVTAHLLPAIPSVSLPEMFGVPEFSPSISPSISPPAGGENLLATGAVKPLISASKISPSSQQKLHRVLERTWLALLVETFSDRNLSSEVNFANSNAAVAPEIGPSEETDSEFNRTITLLNTLLIIAILSPAITMAFFWLVRRLVIRELVTEANRNLNRVDSLEEKITESGEQFQHCSQELQEQIKAVQGAIDFLKQEASTSQVSLQELKDLQLNLLATLEKIESSVRPSQPSNLIPFPAQRADESNSKKAQFNPAFTPEIDWDFRLNYSADFIAEDYLRKGEVLAEERRYSEALAAFEKAVELNPNLEEAWYNKGNILVRMSRNTDALNAYEKLVKMHPEKSEVWYNRGNVLVKLKRYSEALESYDRALEIQPNDDEAWHNRGVLLRKFKRYGEALASYERALEIQPNKYETWHNRGNVLGKLKRYEEAIVSYDRAITIDAGKREVWLNRAVALCKLKRYEQAIASFEQAIGLDPTSAELWSMRGSLLQQLGQYSEAMDSFENAIQYKPNCYEAWLGKGSVLVELQQYLEALDAYEKAIELQPEASEAWRHRGQLLEKMERYSDAIAAYDQAIKLQPNDAEAWRFRGALLSKLKNYQEAISSLGKAISIQKELRSVKMATQQNSAPD